MSIRRLTLMLLSGLVSQESSVKDVFSVRLGNLLPNSSAVIRMVYVAQVRSKKGRPSAPFPRTPVDSYPHEADERVLTPESWQIDEEVAADGSASLRLAIPTAVAPRYQPASDLPTDQRQHAEAVLGTWPKDLLTITGNITTASRYVTRCRSSRELRVVSL